VATYRAASFADAVAFVAAAGELAAMDADLRPDGVVRLSLPADDRAGAEDVAHLAVDRGLEARPTDGLALEVALDAMDIARIKPFWRAVLGYVDDGDDALADPERLGPALWFQQMDEPRTERNRFHLDVTVAHDVAEARVAAAIDAGGRLVSDAAARAFWVLADAEGNEACVCTWQDRG
jgi:4a-hydroxytetrahydrobiopterin dehydratase